MFGYLKTLLQSLRSRYRQGTRGMMILISESGGIWKKVVTACFEVLIMIICRQDSNRVLLECESNALPPNQAAQCGVFFSSVVMHKRTQFTFSCVNYASLYIGFDAKRDWDNKEFKLQSFTPRRDVTVFRHGVCSSLRLLV